MRRFVTGGEGAPFSTAAAAPSSSEDSGCEAFLVGLPTRRFVRGGAAVSTTAAAEAEAASVAVGAAALALTDRLPGEAGSCDEGGDGDEVDAEACERLRGCGRKREEEKRMEEREEVEGEQKIKSWKKKERVRSKKKKSARFLAAAAATIAGHSERLRGLSLPETPPAPCSARCPRPDAEDRGRRRAKKAVERRVERR